MLSDFVPRLATIAILSIPAGIHALIADAGINTPEWVGSLTQISAFGLVAWIVFFMFTKWLPAIQAAHAEQLKEQRDAHALSTKAVADAHANAVAVMTKAFSEALQSQRADLLALSRHE